MQTGGQLGTSASSQQRLVAADRKDDDRPSPVHREKQAARYFFLINFSRAGSGAAPKEVAVL